MATARIPRRRILGDRRDGQGGRHPRAVRRRVPGLPSRRDHPLAPGPGPGGTRRRREPLPDAGHALGHHRVTPGPRPRPQRPALHERRVPVPRQGLADNLRQRPGGAPAALAAALAEAVISMDVVAAVAERVLPPFGASGLTVQVVEGDRLRVIGAVGYPQPFVDLIAGPMSKFPQAAEALRTHTPWFISSPRQYAKRFPQAAGWPKKSRKQAWAFMPLAVSGRR